MSRCPIAVLALALSAFAQQPPAAPKPPAQQAPEHQSDDVVLPPEEDKSTAPKEYSFNPLQAQKEVSAGEFYARKGNLNAAAIRFREATKWDDGNAEAWLRLGETEEKNHDLKAAREAYEKYVQLAPAAKNSPDIKKRLEKLSASR
jgi:tetratricopeptide (TPR) repeat protein